MIRKSTLGIIRKCQKSTVQLMMEPFTMIPDSSDIILGIIKILV